MQTLERIEALANAIHRSRKVSLFDYIGTPAGKELGHKVWETSQKLNIPTEKVQVKTLTYSGKVNKYPEMFLDMYFFMNKGEGLLKESKEILTTTLYFNI